MNWNLTCTKKDNYMKIGHSKLKLSTLVWGHDECGCPSIIGEDVR